MQNFTARATAAAVAAVAAVAAFAATPKAANVGAIVLIKDANARRAVRSTGV